MWYTVGKSWERHASIPDDQCYLIPASSWVDKERGGLLPLTLSSHMHHRAADCGGFVAARLWHGEYRYTLAQYINWLQSGGFEWAAMMDFCCEQDSFGAVEHRQEQTTANAWRCWADHKNVAWTWVPTIQGRKVADYRRHAQEMKLLIDKMQCFYAERDGEPSVFRVGIGTLCNRVDITTIRQIVQSVSEELPFCRFHLWGVKLKILQSPIALPKQVLSCDTAAWTGRFGHGINEYKHAASKGYTQRAYAYEQVLPRYHKRAMRAANGPKMVSMFEEGEAI